MLPTFEERFEYLKLGGEVGKDTFGFDRWINQRLGVPGYELQNGIYVHHMNPVLPKDIVDASEFLKNPEYLICVSFNTHQAIHYGDKNLLPKLIERRPNDTCPWKN